jgi:hypothetical protein
MTKGPAIYTRKDMNKIHRQIAALRALLEDLENSLAHKTTRVTDLGVLYIEWKTRAEELKQRLEAWEQAPVVALLREALDKLPKEGADGPLKLWFMYDCHAFASLPLDPDAAAEKISEILKEPRGRCGMLCSHHYKPTVHHDWQDADGGAKFIEATRAWVRAAIEQHVPTLRDRIEALIAKPSQQPDFGRQIEITPKENS